MTDLTVYYFPGNKIERTMTGARSGVAGTSRSGEEDESHKIEKGKKRVVVVCL